MNDAIALIDGDDAFNVVYDYYRMFPQEIGALPAFGLNVIQPPVQLWNITFESLVERRREFDAGCGFPGRMRDDEILAFGKRLADRLPGAPAHDHAVSGRQSAEALHVVGQTPRKAIVDADHAVARNRGDQRDSRHSATLRRRPWRAGGG